MSNATINVIVESTSNGMAGWLVAVIILFAITVIGYICAAYLGLWGVTWFWKECCKPQQGEFGTGAPQGEVRKEREFEKYIQGRI